MFPLFQYLLGEILWVHCTLALLCLTANVNCPPGLQLPTQIYMAVLYAVLDLLLNFQHCFYNFWRKPRQKREQQEQQANRTAAIAQQQQTTRDGSKKSQSSNSNTSNEHVEKLPLDDSRSLQDCPGSHQGIQDSPMSLAAAPLQLPRDSFEVANPAAHQLRALSAGNYAAKEVCIYVYKWSVAQHILQHSTALLCACCTSSHIVPLLYSLSYRSLCYAVLIGHQHPISA